MSEAKTDVSDKLTEPFHRSLLFWTIVGTLGTWVGVLVVIAGAFVINDSVQDAYNKASLTILIPPTNSTVSERSILSGHSNLRGFNHYIIVTDVPEGKHYVQDGPLPLGANGLWSQTVPFGEAGKNCGVQFLVMVFATHKQVAAGVIDNWANLPRDAIFSPSVAVTRAC